jgi:dTDP-4-dehydrorhamnose reductase
LARTIFELSEVKADLSPITSGAYAAPARRPAYSVLDPMGLRSLGLPIPRAWRDALAAYLRERADKQEAKPTPK